MLWRISGAESASPVLIRMFPFGVTIRKQRQVVSAHVVHVADHAVRRERPAPFRGRRHGTLRQHRRQRSPKQFLFHLRLLIIIAETPSGNEAAPRWAV